MSYTMMVFDRVNRLPGVKEGSEDWERLNMFVTKLQYRSYYMAAIKSWELIGIYYTRDQVAILLGGRKWKERLYLLLEHGVIEKTGIRNPNNYFQELYYFKPVRIPPLRWFVPIKHIRVINSLNIYYDSKAQGKTGDIRRLVLPNLRKLKFKVTAEEFYQVSQDRYYYELIHNWNKLRGLEIYDYASQDDFGGRIHTIITNLPKALRRCIRLDGERVIELDIHQCQVMILDKILREHNPDNSFSRWFDSVNDIYQQYQLRLNLATREQGKEQFCISVFSDTNTRAAQEFIKQFPDTRQVFYNAKKHDYRNMARILQRAEVQFFRKVWFELRVQRIPFLSIHDALLIPQSKIIKAYDILVDKLRTEGYSKYNIHTTNYE